MFITLKLRDYIVWTIVYGKIESLKRYTIKSIDYSITLSILGEFLTVNQDQIVKTNGIEQGKGRYKLF